MKKLFYYSIIVLACLAVNNKVFAQSANTTLSNLTSPTKVNVNLVPDNNNKRNLGSATKGWKNLYLDTAVYLGGLRFLASPKGDSGGSNTAVGINTLFSNTSGYFNTATGKGAMFKNTNGYNNTSNGYYALAFNISGAYNTANGFEALLNNTSVYNTATGAYALVTNTTGYDNTADGVSALYHNTTGIDNTASGLNALQGNTAGIDNTASGVDALNMNNAGNYNTGVGAGALFSTTGSAYNTAIGYNAGSLYDNGWNNVFLGANVDVTGPGFYNVIAIGQGTVCTDVSQVTMGNGATATYRAYANWTNISDGRFKKNIKENVPGLEFINKLQPITYTLDATGIDNFLHKDLPQDKQSGEKAKAVMNKALAEKEKVVYTGFVAQDVEKAAKSLNYDFSGVDAAKNDKDLYGLRYAEFVVPLVKGMQELSKMNDAKDARIDSLENKNNNLELRIAKLEAMMNVNQAAPNGQQSTVISSSSLQQNIPNPFNHTTTINYTLPQTYSSARIIVTDKSGKVLKEVTLSAKGKGSLKLDTSTLSSGAYQYSLYVNGKLIDTKQMEHIK